MYPTLIILSTEPRFRGGEFQAIVLANGLLQRGVSVTIACNRDGALKNSDCPSARWVRFSHHHGLDLKGCVVLFREIAGTEHPVVLCNDSKALTLAFFVSLIRRVPFIAVRRVYFPFAKNCFSRMKYRAASHMVAISGAIADRCRTILPGSPVTVIPSVTVAPGPAVERTTMRERMGLQPDEFVCLSVADFTNPGKRFPLLMKTATAIRERYSHFRLVLVGLLPERSAPLPAWCIAPGFSTTPHDYYAVADMYLCTSLHEGLGTAILDAVIRDIPAVAPAAGGTADLFTDDAWLADPDSDDAFLQKSLEILANTENARSRAAVYGERARHHFSTLRMVDNYLQLIDSLAGEAPESSGDYSPESHT